MSPDLDSEVPTGGPEGPLTEVDLDDLRASSLRSAARVALLGQLLGFIVHDAYCSVAVPCAASSRIHGSGLVNADTHLQSPLRLCSWRALLEKTTAFLTI